MKLRIICIKYILYYTCTPDTLLCSGFKGMLDYPDYNKAYPT